MVNNNGGSENRIFWIFLALHLVIWTLVPALTNHNLPIDVIEGLAWGNEGLWGYHKHPPLSPWLMDVFATFSNSSDWAQYLLSQLSVCAAFIGMWVLGKEFLSPLKALISVLLLEGVYYHGYASPEFNANIVLLPFWSLSILAFYKAVETRKLMWWVILGGAAALAVLGKYFTGFLLISMFAYLVATKKGRSQFKTAGPYAALLMLLLMLTPHLLWMVETNFTTLSYGVNRASGSASVELKNHIVYPLKFLISQIVLLVPLLLMLAAFGLKQDRSDARSGNTAILSFMAFGPPLLIMALSAALGWKLRSMWGAPLFLMSGVLLMYFLMPNVSAARMPRFKAVFIFFALIGPIAYVAVYAVRPLVKDGGKRTQFPGSEIALQLSDEWKKRYPEKPLHYVMGDVWRSGNITYYLKKNETSVETDRNKRTISAFIDGDIAVAPWVTTDEFSQKGGLVVWKNTKQPGSQKAKFISYKKLYPELMEMSPLTFEWDTWFGTKEVNLNWAILPPK